MQQPHNLETHDLRHSDTPFEATLRDIEMGVYVTGYKNTHKGDDPESLVSIPFQLIVEPGNVTSTVQTRIRMRVGVVVLLTSDEVTGSATEIDDKLETAYPKEPYALHKAVNKKLSMGLEAENRLATKAISKAIDAITTSAGRLASFTGTIFGAGAVGTAWLSHENKVPELATGASAVITAFFGLLTLTQILGIENEAITNEYHLKEEIGKFEQIARNQGRLEVLAQSIVAIKPQTIEPTETDKEPTSHDSLVTQA